MCHAIFSAIFASGKLKKRIHSAQNEVSKKKNGGNNSAINTFPSVIFLNHRFLRA